MKNLVPNISKVFKKKTIIKKEFNSDLKIETNFSADLKNDKNELANNLGINIFDYEINQIKNTDLIIPTEVMNVPQDEENAVSRAERFSLNIAIAKLNLLIF